MFSSLKQRLNSLPVSLKVTIWYTLLMALVFILCASFMMHFMDNLRTSKDKIVLQKHVVNIAKHATEFEEFQTGVYLLLYDRDGQLLEGRYPEEFPPDIPYDDQPEVHLLELDEHSYFYYDMRVATRSSHGQWVRGIIPTDGLHEGMRHWVQSLLLSLPLFLCIAALIGYRIVKRGFRPVETISQTVRSIGDERDLSKRIQLDSGGDEIHQMAHTFNEMLDKVEESLKREKRFSADVSHELRTPVSVIMSESEYGKDFTEDVTEAKESFATIFTQAKHMSRLINELLELARIENPANTPMEMLPYSAMLSELAASYAEKPPRADIRFTFAIEPSLTVHGNQPLLYLAITNLLNNAFKFTRDTIELSLKRTGQGRTLLAIRDNGCGMSSEELTQIWDRLYQADRNRNTKGIGIGLALVRRITAIHHGRAWAESQPDQGSTFYIEI